MCSKFAVIFLVPFALISSQQTQTDNSNKNSDPHCTTSPSICKLEDNSTYFVNISLSHHPNADFLINKNNNNNTDCQFQLISNTTHKNYRSYKFFSNTSFSFNNDCLYKFSLRNYTTPYFRLKDDEFLNSDPCNNDCKILKDITISPVFSENSYNFTLLISWKPLINLQDNITIDLEKACYNCPVIGSHVIDDLNTSRTSIIIQDDPYNYIGCEYDLRITSNSGGVCFFQAPLYLEQLKIDNNSSREPHNYNKFVHYFVLICFFVLFFMLFVCLKSNLVKKCGAKMRNLHVCRRFINNIDEIHQHHHNSQLMGLRPNQISLKGSILYCGPKDDSQEFPRNRLEFKEFIGQGAFGQVFSAKAYENDAKRKFTMVAVKTLAEDVTNEQINDFKAEIDIFKKIGEHRNVVKLLGYCTREKPILMIMELVPCGDLKKYLLDLREEWRNRSAENSVFFKDVSEASTDFSDNSSLKKSSSYIELPATPVTPITPLLSDLKPEKILNHVELQKFAHQIASGMAHLEKIQVTHRDLAARNILINEHKVLKISDFGLSRCGPYYVNRKSRKLPLRWMALEAIIEQKYDSRSDVWSFGIVLWEIATLGAFPYEKVPDGFLLHFLQLGNRLQRPEICTDELYDVMLRCWDAQPEKRPTFKELQEMLDPRKNKVYVHCSQWNPLYAFPVTVIEQLDL